MMETIMELLPALIAGLLGAAIPMLVSFYNAKKAKAAADGIQDWKDDFFKYTDDFAKKIAEGEAPE